MSSQAGYAGKLHRTSVGGNPVLLNSIKVSEKTARVEETNQRNAHETFIFMGSKRDAIATTRAVTRLRPPVGVNVIQDRDRLPQFNHLSD